MKDKINQCLWDKIISTPNVLSKFIMDGRQTACVYPKPYDGTDVVRWFYSRNNTCQVFFACSAKTNTLIENNSWAEVSEEFTEYVELELFPYCAENTDWVKCSKYGRPYDEEDSDSEYGCEGTICWCEPFGAGDFTYGIAEENEFYFSQKTIQ